MKRLRGEGEQANIEEQSAEPERKTNWIDSAAEKIGDFFKRILLIMFISFIFSLFTMTGLRNCGRLRSQINRGYTDLVYIL